MGDASLAVKQTTKDRLDEHYRSAEYPSQDELIDGMMDAIPSQEQIEEGCFRCGKQFRTTRFEELNAVTFVFHSEEHGTRDTQLFCSAKCLKEERDEVKAPFPREPKRVVVGGKDELRAELANATFVLDSDHMGVSIDVPGAFTGTDSHGNEYDYVGEPVFIQNDEDEWVQDGIVEEIHNEEAHTGLTISQAFGSSIKLYHPDEEVRADYKENSIVCPECESYYRYYEDDQLPFDCPECGNTIPEHLAEDDDSDGDGEDDACVDASKEVDHAESAMGSVQRREGDDADGDQ